MAAILGLDDKVVEDICASIDEVVVPANYNSPGQIVISGSVEGFDKAIELLKEKRQAVISHAVTKGLSSLNGGPNAKLRDRARALGAP